MATGGDRFELGYDRHSFKITFRDPWGNTVSEGDLNPHTWDISRVWGDHALSVAQSHRSRSLTTAVLAKAQFRSGGIQRGKTSHQQLIPHGLLRDPRTGRQHVLGLPG